VREAQGESCLSCEASPHYLLASPHYVTYKYYLARGATHAFTRYANANRLTIGHRVTQPGRPLPRNWSILHTTGDKKFWAIGIFTYKLLKTQTGLHHPHNIDFSENSAIQKRIF